MMIDDACPVCKMPYGNTALSRVDNKTKICSLCAKAEAFDNFGIKTTREMMQRAGHINYKCFIEEAN